MGYEIANIRKKIRTIRKAGEKAVLTGTVNIFQGWSEELKKRVFLGLEFEENHAHRNIVSKLEDLETRYGVQFAIGGRDYPLHTTIQEAKGDFFDLRIDKNFSLFVPGTVLGRNLIFEKVVLDGSGNLLYVTDDIKDWVYSARESVSRNFSALGLEPIPLDNLLHSTLCRIVYAGKKKKDRVSVLKKLRHIAQQETRALKQPTVFLSKRTVLDTTYYYLTGESVVEEKKKGVLNFFFGMYGT